jgi:hypothetical protein
MRHEVEGTLPRPDLDGGECSYTATIYTGDDAYSCPDRINSLDDGLGRPVDVPPDVYDELETAALADAAGQVS